MLYGQSHKREFSPSTGGELVEVSEIRFDWPQFLPVERIKAGLTETALGLTMFTALVCLLLLPLNSCYQQRI
jgi:hypothetical protein